ncbi:MAG: 3,5-cyclic-nucleotide phosphodiesterase [Marmoricola sp.]|nr:3,5-cyclic-nucleotide phosphodiesterase [Marmoricola sp.]
MKPLGQHPLPRHVVAHVSDPHLLAERRLYDTIDTHENLRRALARLSRLETPPQAIVFTGDLADRAEPKAYVRLREIVEPAAAELGAQVVWVMGNHDERETYARELFGEEVTDGAAQDRVHDVAGLRVVALDTSVPGYHHGELSASQLAWLRDVLAEPAPHGTLLALHHPPIPVPMTRAAAAIELHDQHLLAEVIEGSDVRGVIGGHFHFSSFSTFAGVPVSVASATCYMADPAPVGRLLSAVDGHQAFTMLHLYDDRIVHSVVPVPDADEVAGYPMELAGELEAMEPADRLELLSAKDSPVWSHENPLD